MGRDKIDAQPGWDLFRRPFSHYTDKFKVFLQYKFPKVVFLDEELFKELQTEVRRCTMAMSRTLTCKSNGHSMECRRCDDCCVRSRPQSSPRTSSSSR
jgi:hypothetical protein